MAALNFVLADKYFYAPLDCVTDRGVEYRPSVVPDGWTQHRGGFWTQWMTDAKLSGVQQGWKIHVSARMERAVEVLDTVAAVLFAERVPFKHISCSRFFLLAHEKHASRQQSGKFCAAYPPEEATARRVMEQLADLLDGEEGPFVLTDRRFRESSVVYYRYGAFQLRSKIRPDGFSDPLIRDGYGNDVLDHRSTRFTLPDGIVDPFVKHNDRTASTGVPIINGYKFTTAIAHSNGGGAYRARDEKTGRQVFIKEARAHNGLTSPTTTAQDRLRDEYATLRKLHAAAPGICPEPIDYFRVWEHEFMVTELVPGIPLRTWMIDHNPIIWSVADAKDFDAYYQRCMRVLDTLQATVDRLHTLGYVFVDLSPSNVLVDDDLPRLVDFELSWPLNQPARIERVGTPGYFPPSELISDDRTVVDQYGLASVALSLIAPLNCTADRHPAVLAHLRHQIERHTEIPSALWAKATRFREYHAGDVTPSPHQVEAEPLKHLGQLRDGLVDGLLEMATTSDAERVFPVGPKAYLTNTLCVAHGLAGIAHALGKAGVGMPDRVLERLAEQGLADMSDLPPGLDVGTSGIAWVLADHGLLDEARQLLKSADDHPLLAASATLGHGRAGVGLAHLAFFEHTGDEWHLRRAVELADSIPSDGSLSALLGPDDAVGLRSGRAGIALLHYYLGHVSGNPRHFDKGVRLLHEELNRAIESEGGLLFPVSEVDRRLMPYLSMGSAGVGFVASRYLAVVDDQRLATAMRGLLASAQCAYTVYGGLYTGMAGLGLFLADHARRHADDGVADQALRVANRLFMFAVPHSAGIHIHGEHDLRLSCDLSLGSAGLLLFVDMLLNDRTDPFLTLDRLAK